MSIGAFGENFPYSNFHDLNMDWIVKIAKDFLDQYTHIQDIITQGIEDIGDKTDEGIGAIEQKTQDELTALQNKYTELAGLLDQWYTTHSEDIATQLANAISSFNTSASQIVQTVIQDIPADYSALTSKVDYLEQFMTLAMESGWKRLDNTFYIYEDKLLLGTGLGVETLSGYDTTDFIPIVSPTARFKGVGFTAPYYASFILFDETYAPLYTGRGSFQVSLEDYPTAKYFRASRNTVSNDLYVDLDNNQDAYMEKLIGLFSINGEIPSEWYIYDNTIIGNNGIATETIANYKMTDYIPIINRDIHIYGDFFPTYYTSFVLYDASFTPVYIARGKQHINLASYPTARYFRAVTSTQGYNKNYIGSGVKDIVFKIGASEFYTTLRDGIANAIKFSHSVVYVMPGTYNLATEFATEISDGGTSTVGIRLANNIVINFMSGSYVTALFPSSNEFISTYFSPFFGMNFTLVGMNMEASNCRYCVHDEQASDSTPYRNVYRNCIMKNTSHASSGATFVSPQCIGGGMGKWGVIEIIGGIYESEGDTTHSPAISYHNGASSDCDGRIFISDVYLADNNRFEFASWGSSTHMTKVCVNNCSMTDAIVEITEAGQTDNMEIIDFNNTIR